MKQGARALGIAESTADQQSVVAGCVARADHGVEEFCFDQWTVGGTDATATVLDLFDRLDREDLQYLLLSGIAPAWFNVLDMHEIHAATDLPTLSVSFEESEGLAEAIRAGFDEPAAVDARLETYRAQPERRPLTVNGETVFVRSVGLDSATAATVVRGFTPVGGRPAPLRVARLAARAAADWFDRVSSRQ